MNLWAFQLLSFLTPGIYRVYASKKIVGSDRSAKSFKVAFLLAFQMNSSRSMGSVHLRKNPIAW